MFKRIPYTMLIGMLLVAIFGCSEDDLVVSGVEIVGIKPTEELVEINRRTVARYLLQQFSEAWAREDISLFNRCMSKKLLDEEAMDGVRTTFQKFDDIHYEATEIEVIEISLDKFKVSCLFVFRALETATGNIKRNHFEEEVRIAKQNDEWRIVEI